MRRVSWPRVAVVIQTSRYALEQVNEGYRDLLAGKNIRGVILHES
jgi:Zn-dependent alcohol dehydrogenase